MESANVDGVRYWGFVQPTLDIRNNLRTDAVPKETNVNVGSVSIGTHRTRAKNPGFLNFSKNGQGLRDNFCNVGAQSKVMFVRGR